jgi:UDP:flavonoid glycosyltransferase YjiC (YdhE family)
MPKFLISTMPATGHVNPFLLTASKLVERGHEVLWHTGSEVQDRVEATGACFTPMVHAHNILESTLEAQQKDGLATANEAMINLFVAPMLGQLQDYQEILMGFPADALLVDMCSLGAVLLHEKGGPVWASVGINPFRTSESPLYGSGQMPAITGAGRLRNRILNKLSEIFLVEVTRTYNRQRLQIGLLTIPRGKTVFDYLVSPYLHLQGTTPAFEFPYQGLPPQVHFVGPMLPPMPADFALPSWWAELDSGRPVVHVTQGTVATDITELVLPTIRALADEDVLLVVTTPEPGGLGPLPSNVRVECMIPHSLLLPHVDAMVTNGGYNGVKVALVFGVPLVAAGATEDKPEVGSRIAWSGAGINLKTGSPAPEELRRAVMEILRNPSYRQNARAIQADFDRYDSPSQAAELLELLVKTKAPVTRAQ